MIPKRGYSRDQRPDCVQANVALVVTREGIPLGQRDLCRQHDRRQNPTRNRGDHGRAVRARQARVGVMDRGMVSQANLDWLRQEQRLYLVGTPRTELARLAKELADDSGWEKIGQDVEVKLCRRASEQDLFVLCRSAARVEKEKAMHERIAQRIEAGLCSLLRRMERSRRRLKRPAIERQLGRLLQRNSRAAARYSIEGSEDTTVACGLKLRSSTIADWDGEQLWKTYVQLTEAEAAFRVKKKSDLRIRPTRHHKADRILAHILICFLAYVLWKTPQQWQSRAGLGDSPRTLFTEFSRIHSSDVVLPLADGSEHTLRIRCVVRPEGEQAILLQRPGLTLSECLSPPLRAEM